MLVRSTVNPLFLQKHSDSSSRVILFWKNRNSLAVDGWGFPYPAGWFILRKKTNIWKALLLLYFG